MKALLEEKETKHSTVSFSMVKTFWRGRLFSILQNKNLLTDIVIRNNSFEFITTTWDEYWQHFPKYLTKKLQRLHNGWCKYIDSKFDISCAKFYSDTYIKLLCESCRLKIPPKTFIKILGFENFILRKSTHSSCFAAATTNFRNPLSVTLYANTINRNSRFDFSLLPLIAANDNGVPRLFYHYRKQRLLRNTEKNLLFFPVLDNSRRSESFHGLELLTGKLIDNWNSRESQRALLVSQKVLTPYLKQSRVTEKSDKPFKILDIGSGTGLFTSKILSKLLESGLFKNRKIELTLVDVLPSDPGKHFQTSHLIQLFSKVEYISSDLNEWLNSSECGSSTYYDIVFIFKVLHNMSSFGIDVVDDDSRQKCGRYLINNDLSNYYKSLVYSFPCLSITKEKNGEEGSFFFPVRTFNESCLFHSDSKSIIDSILTHAHTILIEDCDLTPELLVQHIEKNVSRPVSVYDLTKPLRLSTNYFYMITQHMNLNIKGKKLCPI